MADRVCDICKKIIDGRSLILGEKHFHADCFVCKKCEQPLTGSLCQDGDDYYCVDCYKEKFAPKCSVCKSAIEGKALMLGGDVFCPGCFACNYCNSPIDGANYKIMQGKRCCLDCEPNFCALKSCREFCPEGDRVMLRGAAAPYHVKCLTCKTCSKLQSPKTANLFNSTVFCKKHFEEEKKTKIDRGRGCDGCREPITGMGVLAGGKQWHKECLVCAENGCKAKLAKAKVFPSNGKVYCVKHKKSTPVAAKSAAELRSEARAAVSADPTYDDIGGASGGTAAAAPPPAAAAVAAAAGQETYDNGEYPGGAPGAGGGGGETYDNNEHGAPQGEETYDNGEHGAPQGEETYDNGEYPGDAAAAAGAGEETYDNNEYPGEEEGVYATAEVAVDGEATYDNGQYSEDAVYVTNAEVADDTYDNTDYTGEAAKQAPPPAAQYSTSGALIPEATYLGGADVGAGAGAADPDLTYSSIDDVAPRGPIVPDLAYADNAELGAGTAAEPTYADAELITGSGSTDGGPKYRPVYEQVPETSGTNGGGGAAGYEYTETVPSGPPAGSPAAMQAEVDRRVKAAMATKEAEIAAKVRAEVMAEQAGEKEEYAEVDDDGAPGTAAAAAPAASKGVSPTQKPFGRSKSEHPQAEKKLLSSWLSPTGKSVVKQSAAGGSLLTVDGHVQRRTASARPGNASPAFKRALAFVGGMKPTDLIQTAKSSDGN